MRTETDVETGVRGASTAGAVDAGTGTGGAGLAADAGLEARAVRLGYDATPIVHGVDFRLRPGSFTTIIGPNGCGKSTLLKGMARLLAPSDGQVVLDGKTLQDWKPKTAARRIGLLPQTSVAPEGITVHGLVSRGRYPHQGFLQPWSDADERAVEAALERTGLVQLRHASVNALSGGQKQRVWVAMALAQETEILLLDEPTTYLDIAFQLDLLELFAELNAEGTTILSVLHDLTHAARYSDHIVAMKDGRIEAEGAPSEVVTEATVERIFGITCDIVPDPRSGNPLVIPLTRAG
ncbi:ABC transporter ATP-binding protein [Brevibacterium litoralis]|uniref:ABC transporter ATP-binding protein n=1 Tax=Brevibacterium litoralis TaxID=3138935 RepID=UPI0032EED580